MESRRDDQKANGTGLKALFFSVAFIVTVVLVLGGAYVQEGFDIEVGGVAAQKFTAPRKIVNTVATERNRAAAEEAAEKVEPVLERDTAVAEEVHNAFDTFFERVTQARHEMTLNHMDDQADAPETSAVGTPAIEDMDMAIQGSVTQDGATALPIHLNDSLTQLLMDMSNSAYTSFERQVNDVTDVIFEDGLQDVEAKGLMAVRDEVDKLDLNADLKTLCYEIITAYIKPNIVVNEDATQNAKEERAAKYDTVYYLKDQTIVDAGQIITEEAYAAMDSLSLVKKDGGRNIFLIVGALLLISSMFGLFLLYGRYLWNAALLTRKESLLLFTLYLSVLLISYVTIGLPYQLSGNLIFIMLIAMLFDTKVAIVANMLITIICMLITKGDMAFIIYYIFTGTFVSLISKFTAERNKIIIAGFLTCIVSLVSYAGVTFFFEKAYSPEMLNGALYAAGMGLISVIVSIGSAPFWEAVFGIVTPYRLIDLANPNSPILRRLTIEAPGTYHHSLIVANLAETAAYEIGANPTLARAGGYYHDIGKLKYPQYFSENQAGVNPHDTMDPYSSVQVLVSHVAFGLELAEKNRIPHIIQDIICQHHGTTLMKYFYARARKQWETAHPEAGEDAVSGIDENDFRYHYAIPQSREAALVMLADTVEAAVRSMIPSGKTMQDVENLVRRLVKDKLEDGQLAASNLTINDIETTIRSFLPVFKGMYHDRIPYPETLKEGKPAKVKEA